MCICCLTNALLALDNKTEVDLHAMLFETTEYNKNVIPRCGDAPLDMHVDLYLLSISELNEKRQTISIMAFLEIKWTDCFLTWNPSDYSNVTMINAKINDVWRPDLTLSGTYDKPLDLIDKEGNANIDSAGHVMMWPYGMHTVSCSISIASFPFDKQVCTLDFVSWTNPSSRLTLANVTREVSRHYYNENGEWTLLDITKRHERRPFGDDHWDHVFFDIYLERKSLYVVMNVIIPILCIAFLNCFCFVLPSEGGERVTFAISLFLTLVVFMTIVNDSLPESSDEISTFGLYVGLQLLGSGLTIIVTTLSLNMFYRDDEVAVGKFWRFLQKITCTKHTLYKLGQSDRHFQEPGLATIDGQFTNKQSQKNELLNDHDPTKCTSLADDSAVPHRDQWRRVSAAFDRLSLCVAFAWHVILLVVVSSLLHRQARYPGHVGSV